MSKLLKIKGEVLPLCEEKVELVGRDKDGRAEFYGEEDVSQNIRSIASLSYDRDVHIGNKVRQKIADADLIIFSPGSLYTSILPHLIVDDIVEAVRRSSAPIMYVSNLVTQPGETDGYNVSDHLEVLNRHLQGRKVDIVLSNNAEIDPETTERYLRTENKTLVRLDRELVERQGARIIEGDIFELDEEKKIRHNALRTAYMIFSYLMEG